MDNYTLADSAHKNFGTGPTLSRGCRRPFPWSTALPSAAKQHAVAEALIEGRRPEHKVFQFPVSRVAISFKSSARFNTTFNGTMDGGIVEHRICNWRASRRVHIAICR